MPDPNLATQAFSCTKGLQQWLVPEGVTSVKIDASGAAGGTSALPGGKGARVAGTYAVTPGDTLFIIVGQKGPDGEAATFIGAGGGGASAVIATTLSTSGNVLLVAGGGGGAGAKHAQPPSDGQATTNGARATGDHAGVAGHNGEGGGAAETAQSAAAGGGGLKSAGGGYPAGGGALLSGGAGGPAMRKYSDGTPGGFGGGGGGCGGNLQLPGAGGGGGGYSGGSAADYGVGGGGGGSFNACTDSSAVTTTGGGSTGDGSVTLTFDWPASLFSPQDEQLPLEPWQCTISIGPGQVPPPPGFQTQSNWNDLSYEWSRPVICQVVAPDGYTLDGVNWTFSPDDLSHLASGYTQTSALGAILPLLNTALPALTIYPYAPDTYAYSCVARVRRPDNTIFRQVMDGEFNVQAPTGNGIARTSPPTINIYNGKPFLELGNHALQRRGIMVVFDATLDAPVTGAIGLIQLCKGYRAITRPDSYTVATTLNQWFLDGPIPLMHTGIRIAQGQTPQTESCDNPRIQLPDDATKVEVNETFRTFLCYRSDFPGSAWMPVGYIEWGWNAVAQKGGDGNWPAAPTIVSYTAAPNLTYVASTTPMIWTGNVSTMKNTLLYDYDAVEPLAPLPNPQSFRQMLVQFSGNGSGALQAAIEAKLGVNLGPPISTPKQGYLVWLDPDTAATAAGITDGKGATVTTAIELPVEMRYEKARTPGEQASMAAAKTWAVAIAPYCLIRDDDLTTDDEEALAALLTPTLDQVGTALVAICTANNVPGVTQSALGDDGVLLTFPSPPDLSILPLLAAHPQANYVQVASSFRIDAPVNPNR